MASEGSRRRNKAVKSEGRSPKCGKCGGSFRRDGICYQCGISVEGTLVFPEGYEAPIRVDEVGRRFSTRTYTDEEVYAFRREYRNGGYTSMKSFAKAKGIKPTQHQTFSDALMGRKRYSEV